jgi:hypothetical protein
MESCPLQCLAKRGFGSTLKTVWTLEYRTVFVSKFIKSKTRTVTVTACEATLFFFVYILVPVPYRYHITDVLDLNQFVFHQVCCAMCKKNLINAFVSFHPVPSKLSKKLGHKKVFSVSGCDRLLSTSMPYRGYLTHSHVAA